MKTLTRNFTSFLFIFILSSIVIADTFSVQGVLRDPLGKTVDDGFYAMTFRLYDAATGGNLIWEETQGSVQVLHGVYNAELGIVTSLAPVPFDETYWLGLSIEGGVELEPRYKLLKSPAAMSVLGTENVFPSVGPVGVGTFSPEAALHIVADPAETSYLMIENDAGNAKVVVTDDDRMGINVDAPAAGLHIKGEYETDDVLLLERSTGENILIVDAAGHVGLGVENPAQILEIDGNLKMHGGAILFDDGSSLSSAFFGGSASSLTNNATIIVNTDADDNGSGDVQFNVGATTEMVIKNNGNVGIGNGTETPAGKLDVNGTILGTSFLDKNNTLYYLDPSNTNTSGNFAGYVHATKFFDEDNTSYYLDPASTETSANFHGAVAATYGHFTEAVDATWFRDADNTNFYCNPNGISILNDVRGSIYYDRDNTSYYLDPDESSVSASLAGEVKATKFTDKANTAYYVDPGDSGTSARLNGQIRASKFVDDDNTSYYVDPNNSTTSAVLDGDIDLDFGDLIGIDDIDGQLPGNSLYMNYWSSGNVYVASGGGNVKLTGSGVAGVGAYDTGYKLYVAGVVRADDFSEYSDERFKTNIANLENSLGKIMRLQGRSFSWKQDATRTEFNDKTGELEDQPLNFREGPQIGFIAQELEEVLPELVSEGEDGYKSITYSKIIPVVVEAMKEQQARIDRQEELINTLLERVEQLENR